MVLSVRGHPHDENEDMPNRKYGSTDGCHTNQSSSAIGIYGNQKYTTIFMAVLGLLHLGRNNKLNHIVSQISFVYFLTSLLCFYGQGCLLVYRYWNKYSTFRFDMNNSRLINYHILYAISFISVTYFFYFSSIHMNPLFDQFSNITAKYHKDEPNNDKCLKPQIKYLLLVLILSLFLSVTYVVTTHGTFIWFYENHSGYDSIQNKLSLLHYSLLLRQFIVFLYGAYVYCLCLMTVELVNSFGINMKVILQSLNKAGQGLSVNDIRQEFEGILSLVKSLDEVFFVYIGLNVILLTVLICSIGYTIVYTDRYKLEFTLYFGALVLQLLLLLLGPAKISTKVISADNCSKNYYFDICFYDACITFVMFVAVLLHLESR